MKVMQKSMVLLLLSLICAPVHALAPVEETIRQYSEAIQEDPGMRIAGSRVEAASVVAAFYARRGFRPVWADPARFRSLLAVLQGASAHGLDPEDYHGRVLSAWQPEHDDDHRRAERDILATDALVLYGYHLYFGKEDPENRNPTQDLARHLQEGDPVEILEAAIDAPSLAGFMEERLAPNGPFYTGLKSALAHYRDIARDGGWPSLPGGPTLAPGDEDERVLDLRRRLAVTDAALAAPVDKPTRFDLPLAAAVQRFQRHHGLEVDGLVGRRTRAALNVPAAARVDQLRVNLERTRWVFRDLGPRYLIVNIAGFRAYLVENGRSVWDTRVVVGAPYRETPVFKATMTYLVLNPTWTVPPTILRKDVIPALRRDPDYLAKNNMVLLDTSGRRVDSAAIDAQQLGVGRFPYQVRQEPGPRTALGRIKFMFPNEHFVYLHDTPGRDLFERADRSFSSGCIRVEHPLRLAELLLNDPVAWNHDRLLARLDEPRTRTVTLKTPIEVFLVYWTAEPGVDGGVNFFNDVYGRDAAVLAGLQAPLASPAAGVARGGLSH
jgi:murein L,D-transpeptidase YcbB/YkuD